MGERWDYHVATFSSMNDQIPVSLFSRAAIALSRIRCYQLSVVLGTGINNNFSSYLPLHLPITSFKLDACDALL